MDNQQYEFVRGTANDEELEKYRQCFLENGSDKSLQLLKWFHQKNLPGIQSIYYALTNEKEIAAIYTYLPVKLKLMNETVIAMQSFDTLTDHRHRGKGLFIKLASRLEKEESAKQIELVYGFANENSVHGFIKKLGFTYFGDVPFLIKPFRVSYFIKKIFLKNKGETAGSNCIINAPQKLILKNDVVIEELKKFDIGYDALWQKIKNNISIGVNRDSTYMNWRYVEKPGENYMKYRLFKNGSLEAVIIFTLKNKHDGRIGYLMEILYAPGSEREGLQLLKFGSKILKRNKADLTLAWCLPHSYNYNCHKKAGFYNFPEKFRPLKLSMIVKKLNTTHEEEIYNVKNWFFSYSDSDTV
jgi:hypothetical protein